MSRIVGFGLVLVVLIVAALLIYDQRSSGAARLDQEGGPESADPAIVPSPSTSPAVLGDGAGSGGTNATQSTATVSPGDTVPATVIAVPIGKGPTDDASNPTAGNPEATPPAGAGDSEEN